MNRIRVAAATFANNHPVAILTTTTIFTTVVCVLATSRLEKNLAADLAELSADPSNDI